MKPIHKLLLWQLKKQGLEPLIQSQTDQPQTALIQALLQDVNETYWQSDSDRELLERSLEVRSKEIIEIEQLMEQQRALLINSAKMATLGEMASGIAHEINTPLAVISVLSEQFKEFTDAEKINKKRLKDHCEKIERNVQRIAKIVNGLRSFSRNDRMDPFVTIYIKTLVEDVLSLCQERFTLAGVQIKLILPEGNASFQGRPAQLSQVMVNLLNNSYDAISNLEEKWISIGVKEDSDNIFIEVTDSGPGIPTSIQEKLFQAFFTTKEIGKGTGIGLNISYNILKAHHGELYLNSKSKNTQFVLKIPKVQI